MKLFYEPVTTPCGHTFCKECLLRSLDHASVCPLCRFTIHYSTEQTINITMQSILEKYFPGEYVQRSKEEKQETTATIQLPLFLLDTCAFPGQPFPMHIFEPRYRLMMRRCLAGNKQFGLVGCRRSNTGWEPCEIGTSLEILNSNVLPDGRSYITTIGRNRFKIIKHWECDGYKMGEIEWIDDVEEDIGNVNEDLKSIKETITTSLFFSG